MSELAERAQSLNSWGLEVGEFLDEINFRQTHGLPIEPCLEAAPALLRDRIDQGQVADAFAAALAEYLYQTLLGRTAPAWTQRRERFLEDPWFADDSPRIREYLSTATPAPFREHGVFIDAQSLARA